MAIDLLNIQPHKVSKDLSGYITYIYGAPKTGKTTLASQMPDHLILAFESGYRALPGVIAYDITSWSKMREVYRELKKPEMLEHFKCIIVDTVDYAADYCQKYVCNQKGIDALGDLGYGKGWTAFKEEFDDVFHGLTQLGYAVFFIAHDKESTVKDPVTGEDKLIIRPAVTDSSNKIIENMADIYGYAHSVRNSDGTKNVKLTLRDNTDTIRCGCRFKMIDPEIDFNYQSLCNAISKAIDAEAMTTDNKFVTEEKVVATPIIENYDYDALVKEFGELVGTLMNSNQAYFAPKITSIVDKYLGKGKKVSEATVDQAEFIHLINQEIKEDLMPKKA